MFFSWETKSRKQYYSEQRIKNTVENSIYNRNTVKANGNMD